MTPSDVSTKSEDAKRIIKVAISLLYFLSQGVSRFILHAIGRAPDERLVIMYYHGVPSAYRPNFVRQLEAIRRGARVWPASYRGSLPKDRRNVAITFDDAYVSVAQNALPELAARGFHSTIFVPVGSLGSHPTWAVESGSLDSGEIVMAPEQIATLSSSLVTVGSHTSTHPRLSRIDSHHAREEIEGSRVSLQSLTAKDIRLLAFPYGDYDASTIELCRVAGYDYVFGIKPLPVDTTGSDYVRGRVKVDAFDSLLEFFLKYNGAYPWVSHVSSMKKTFENYRKSRTNRQSDFRQTASENKSKPL